MRRLLSVFALCLPLTACIDSELELDFKDLETVNMVSRVQMTPELFEMSGGDAEMLCPGGEYDLSNEGFACAVEEQMTVAVLIDALNGPASMDSPIAQMRGAIAVEALDEDRLKVSLLVSDMVAQMNNEVGDAREMLGMFGPMFEGREIVMRISAPEIEETNGTLSEDQKTAEFKLPLLDMMSGNAPKDFVTIINLDTCTFGFFC